jgi:hypothetical protein
VINPAQIPDEVVKAVAMAIANKYVETYDADPEKIAPHCKTEAITYVTAALAAWPGAHTYSNCELGTTLFLPLPQEPRT